MQEAAGLAELEAGFLAAAAAVNWLHPRARFPKLNCNESKRGNPRAVIVVCLFCFTAGTSGIWAGCATAQRDNAPPAADGWTSSPDCHRTGGGWLGSAQPPACPQPCCVPRCSLSPFQHRSCVGRIRPRWEAAAAWLAGGILPGAGVCCGGVQSTHSLIGSQEYIKDFSHATFWRELHCTESFCLLPAPQIF